MRSYSITLNNGNDLCSGVYLGEGIILKGIKVSFNFATNHISHITLVIKLSNLVKCVDFGNYSCRRICIVLQTRDEKEHEFGPIFLFLL